MGQLKKLFQSLGRIRYDTETIKRKKDNVVYHRIRSFGYLDLKNGFSGDC
jgi:hypothetical protein